MKVAVFGGTGQLGRYLCEGLAVDGHQALCFSRKQVPESKLYPGVVSVVANYKDLNALTDSLKGVDAAICALQYSPETQHEIQPRLIQACAAAGVKRFLPSEFGMDSINLGSSLEKDGIDAGFMQDKIDQQKRIREAGMECTLIFAGGIADYLLPNLRFFEKITTFGEMDVKYYSHSAKDIGYIGAKAATDPRCGNTAVQLDFNETSQAENLALLKKAFPDHKFAYSHTPTDTVIHLAKHGDNAGGFGKAGVETERARFIVNYVVYVAGLLARADPLRPGTVSARALWPEFKARSIENMISDPEFVFE